MVEYKIKLDAVFGSLSDPTRRDILKRVARKQMSVGEIALGYKLTFAAVAKHLSVLERAKLVIKHRQGKEQIVTLSPQALVAANEYLENFEKHWAARLNRLNKHLLSGGGRPYTKIKYLIKY